MRRLVLLPLLALLWTPSGAAQPQPYLVKAINPSFDEQSSEPGGFAHFGPNAIFTATTLQERRELRSSDGTPAGTVLVKDPSPSTALNEQHFMVPVKESEEKGFNLSINLYKEAKREVQYDPPKKIIAKLPAREAEIAKDLSKLEGKL